jgi:hypothetical protein
MAASMTFRRVIITVALLLTPVMTLGNDLAFNRKAAEHGIAEAQYNLGQFYSAGKHGLSVDSETAVYWYRQAAQQGLAVAQYNLGNAYAKGLGFSQDCAWEKRFSCGEQPRTEVSEWC